MRHSRRARFGAVPLVPASGTASMFSYLLLVVSGTCKCTKPMWRGYDGNNTIKLDKWQNALFDK